MLKIDMNCDMAESYGAYRLGGDAEILPHITSANLACGFHASDPIIMAKAVESCKFAGVAVGAHPGYPDLQGFGRRNMAIPPQEVKAMVMYQIGALDAFCRANGIKMQHVKPHGALYNMAAKDYALAKAVCEAIRDYNPDLIVLALYGGELERASRDMGLRTASEFFADRAYEEDGSLVNRRKEGAVIHDEKEAIARTVRMVKEHKVTTITGVDIPLDAQSVCVHGDNAEALAFVQKIRSALQDEGVTISPLREIV